METILAFLSQFGYPLLFVLSILETAVVFGFVIPADTLLVSSGFLAYLEIFELKYSILICFWGAVIGDGIAFSIGRKYGRKVLKENGKLFGIKQKHFQRTEDFFEKHGNKSVFFGRFIGYIRSFVPLFAGINKTPAIQFLLYEIPGAYFWSFTLNMVGFYFGKNWPVIHNQIKLVGETTALAVVLILLSIYFLRRFFKRRKQGIGFFGKNRLK